VRVGILVKIARYARLVKVVFVPTRGTGVFERVRFEVHIGTDIGTGIGTGIETSFETLALHRRRLFISRILSHRAGSVFVRFAEFMADSATAMVAAHGRSVRLHCCPSRCRPSNLFGLDRPIYLHCVDDPCSLDWSPTLVALPNRFSVEPLGSRDRQHLATEGRVARLGDFFFVGFFVAAWFGVVRV